MNTPLHHRASIVAELVERLGNATDEDDQSFLSQALLDESADLERICLSALREARTAEAMAEGVRQIEVDNRYRRQRLERKAETIREAVSAAMAQAGLPKLMAPDMTVSNIPAKKLVVEGRPTQNDYMVGLARASFDWSKTALRAELEAGTKLNFASLVDGFTLRINQK